MKNETIVLIIAFIGILYIMFHHNQATVGGPTNVSPSATGLGGLGAHTYQPPTPLTFTNPNSRTDTTGQPTCSGGSCGGGAGPILPGPPIFGPPPPTSGGGGVGPVWLGPGMYPTSRLTYQPSVGLAPTIVTYAPPYAAPSYSAPTPAPPSLGGGGVQPKYLAANPLRSFIL